ncbi:MAG: GGDEF domain-containing protein [Clostridia bacterium]|nr:GGDEF domain-containing protein [Clostridia bacterium]
MNLFNVLLITIGLILGIELIYSTYQTQNAFDSVFSITDNYLSSQSTTGMLDSLSAGMLKEVRGFIEDGDPGHVFAYEGQRSALNAQLAATQELRTRNQKIEANQHLENALSSFWEMDQAEIYAMRLKADTLRVPLAAYPDFLQSVVLSEEDQALSPEAKIEKASALITSERFQESKAHMDSEIDINHRLISDGSRAEADHHQKLVQEVVTRQKILIFFVILIAFLALIANRMLMIHPIQRAIHFLDTKEKLPVQGSYEIRRLANAYNMLLTDNENKQQALSYTATHDALTGVLNRSAFETAYQDCRKDEHSGLMIVDIDHFKTFNDQYGHDLGDKVLIRVARTIQKHFRKDDMLCRIGGDEFVILFCNTDRTQARVFTEKIDKVNKELSQGIEDIPPISLSAGLAFRHQITANGPDLFKCADIALLNMKEHGRAACAVYQDQAKGEKE